MKFKKELHIFLLIFMVYLFYMSNYGGSYLADSMLAGTMAFVDNGNFIVDDYIKEECKTTGCDYAYYENHFYPGTLPGGSLLAAPLYLLSKPLMSLIPETSNYTSQQLNLVLLNILATAFISSLLSALLSVLLYKFLSHINIEHKKRFLISLIFSFGTIFFIYSTGYYARVLSGFFIFLSFYLLFINKTNLTTKTLFLSGLSAGFAAMIDLPHLMSAGLLFLYLFWICRKKKIIFFLVGAIIPIILLLSYNYAIFDSPLTTPYNHRAADISSKINFESGQSLVNISYERILDYLFSLKYGIFIYMPILFLSFLGFYFGLKTRFYKEITFCLILFLGHFFFYSFFLWYSPCSFGLRYLVSIIPFIILPLIFVKRKYILPLGITSILINYLAPLCYYGCIKDHFDYYLPTILEKGLTSYTFNLISLKITPLSFLTTNTISLIFLIIVVLYGRYIWKN